MPQMFPNLFSPFRIKGIDIRNRIVSTGHDTDLARHGLPSDALIAYQRARAKGGAGPIIVQVVGVHDTARYTTEVLMASDDACIPSFKALFEAIKAEGARVFVQLFHPGRELLGRRNGVQQSAYSASHAPAERFRIVPRMLSGQEINDIIQGYGSTARRLAAAGADGVEIVASHGYLPSQFWNAKINARRDGYGGSLDNRLRFTREVIAAIRGQVPPELIVGLRFSCNEFDADGPSEDDMLDVCRGLQQDLDYFNVIAGTSASASGAVHIAPPMSVENAYLAPFAAALKKAVNKPVIVAGRINQPQDAEKIIAAGAADLCGMTRAMICDPEMPGKAEAGRVDDIRACIACNQACIGHAQLGLSISCIQHPETGRELTYGTRQPAARCRKVMVVGGGPGGMKAAAVAAERGHDVTLHEKSSRLGGQALLAQLLPHRTEFGGIVTNLAREMELAGVTVRTNSPVTAEMIAHEKPDAVILATGSLPQMPEFDQGKGTSILLGDDLVAGKVRTGSRAVVYDWLADWRGMGIAEKLATEGVHVRLAVNGACPGISIQNYVRDTTIGRLHRLGVEMLPFMRFYGAEGKTAFFLHTASQEPVMLEDVDTVVVVAPHRPVDDLLQPVRTLGIEVFPIGDAVTPRTAEEALFEGLDLATKL
ncbi:MAG: FAD-dependent oxidoreductase [Rhodospirillaceae bacterium]|nr:MAG: FAD-dependent oxidoreductase [Rhodospirillaceae bacterium]